MKRVAALLIVFGSLAVSGPVFAQDPPPNLKTDQLVGPVKVVEINRIGYAFRDGKTIETGRAIFRKTNYDRDGNRIEQVTYREGGVISEKLVYTYDILKRNTGYEEYFNLTGQTLLGPRKHIYTLDANGQIVEFLLHESDGLVGSHFTYSYDESGRKIEECFYSWTGKRTGRLVYSYDEQGHLLSTASYNHDEPDAAWKTVSTYDANGHQIEWTQYEQGVLRYKRTFKYDERGRISEQETSEFNKPLNGFSDHAPAPGKVVYSYGERSKEIATYNGTGVLTSREVLTFDAKGNEASQQFFRGDPLVKEIELRLAENLTEYDSHGNWIKKTYLSRAPSAKEGVPSSAEYRIINYYEDK